MKYTKTQEDLIEKTNSAIAELVYPKMELQKAYNYYNGKMDAEQYRYLEENYGIGQPTKVEFIPLVKKHIDALIGEYLGTPILPKVSCKDTQTISAIDREKEIKITKEVYKFLKGKLKNQLLNFIDGKDVTDKNIEYQLNKLVEDINNNFVSEYEVAAQNVIEYIMQSRTTDMHNKLRELFLDILISGWCFYKVHKSSNGNNIQIEVISPLNAFIDKNNESPYVKDSRRAVVRHWLTKSEILNRYGRELSQEDLDKIKDEWKDYSDEYSSYYIRNMANHCVPNTLGTHAGEEVVPGYPTSDRYSRYQNLIPVYETEWIETDKNFVMNRFSTIRIGDDIYILTGKDEDIVRSKDNPDVCSLKLNGVYFQNRSNEPYSLMIACESLQDKYNLLMYFRDNLIANSGTIGDYVDMSLLPTWLGQGPTERLQKYLAYKKTGTALIDSAQEGRMASGQAPINTMFNGFDDTVKAPAIQAIQYAIDSVEATCSSITGVFRERLNGIEQRDAVSNIKQGVTNSFIVTKQYYHQMDMIVKEMLYDLLNTAKVVYKNGLTGTIILGDKLQKLFTALPEHFTISDYDIHIIASTDVMKDMEQIKAIVPELVKAGALPPDMIIEALGTKSLSDLKLKVNRALEKQKAENNQIQQLSQQAEQLQQQLKEAQQELQKAQQQVQQLDAQKLQIEQQRLQMENKLNWYKAQTERTWKERDMDNDEKRVEVELLQLHDGNPYNDKIRQS